MKKLVKTIIRYKLIEKHMELVRDGKYLVAQRLLKFLKDKHIRLGFGDADNALESLLEKMGCHISYGRRYSCTAYL